MGLRAWGRGQGSGLGGPRACRLACHAQLVHCRRGARNVSLCTMVGWYAGWCFACTTAYGAYVFGPGGAAVRGALARGEAAAEANAGRFAGACTPSCAAVDAHVVAPLPQLGSVVALEAALLRPATCGSRGWGCLPTRRWQYGSCIDRRHVRGHSARGGQGQCRGLLWVWSLRVPDVTCGRFLRYVAQGPPVPAGLQACEGHVVGVVALHAWPDAACVRRMALTRHKLGASRVEHAHAHTWGAVCVTQAAGHRDLLGWPVGRAPATPPLSYYGPGHEAIVHAG